MLFSLGAVCECYLWVGVTYFSSVEDDKCEDKSHRKRAFLSKVFISMFGGSFFSVHDKRAHLF